MPETGTVLDEFLPIYAALARPTRARVGLGPGDVDLLDLAVVAMLLGVDGDRSRFEVESVDILRRRLEAAAAGEPEPTWDDLGSG